MKAVTVSCSIKGEKCNRTVIYLQQGIRKTGRGRCIVLRADLYGVLDLHYSFFFILVLRRLMLHVFAG